MANKLDAVTRQLLANKSTAKLRCILNDKLTPVSYKNIAYQILMQRRHESR